MPTISNPPCPCGSSLKYAQCCRPFHRGEEPLSAEALMRSRFAAFAFGEAAYLFRTLHPDHPARQEGEQAFTADIRRSRGSLRYVGLAVIDRDEAPDGLSARVLFHAEIYQKGKEQSFIEASTFLRTDEGWRYRDGQLQPMTRTQFETKKRSLLDFA